MSDTISSSSTPTSSSLQLVEKDPMPLPSSPLPPEPEVMKSFRSYPASPLSPLSSIGGNITLKKATQIVAFCDRDIDAIIKEGRNCACRDRMRQLDILHLHRPHLEIECKGLNLPNHRINIHSLKEIMNLCGGLVGARFSSDEIRNLSELVHQLEHLWFSLELIYKEMTTEEHKLVSIGDNSQNEKAVLFHKLSDEYLTKAKELQSSVRLKQLSTLTERCVIDVSNVNQDPESHIGSPYPKWLLLLKNKYEKYRDSHKLAKGANEDSIVEFDSMKFTLGRFSVFLSCCAVKTIECSAEEWDALWELYQASADSHSFFQDASVINASPELHQHYLSSRFYNFLRSMPELKTTAHEEDAIKKMRFID